MRSLRRLWCRSRAALPSLSRAGSGRPRRIRRRQLRLPPSGPEAGAAGSCCGSIRKPKGLQVSPSCYRASRTAGRASTQSKKAGSGSGRFSSSCAPAQHDIDIGVGDAEAAAEQMIAPQPIREKSLGDKCFGAGTSSGGPAEDRDVLGQELPIEQRRRPTPGCLRSSGVGDRRPRDPHGRGHFPDGSCLEGPHFEVSRPCMIDWIKTRRGSPRPS
jgi:hypothetical protein